MACAALLLCSCQTLAPLADGRATPGRPAPPAEAAGGRASAAPRLAPGAAVAIAPAAYTAGAPAAPSAPPAVAPWTGDPHSAACPGCSPTLPTAAPPRQGLWSAPWQYGPQPPEEYFCNGGDNDLAVQVRDDWSVDGLHEGDTIVHYDTLDGRVEVAASNEVCLYAPRFASVRKVTGMVLHEGHLRTAGVQAPISLAQSEETESAGTVLQPLQPGRNLAVRTLNRFRDNTRGAGLQNRQAVAGAEGGFLPFEDFLIIRRGEFDNSEKARLNERLTAAFTWTHEKAVQVVIDDEVAVEKSGEVGMQSIYTYELPTGKSRLRVVKVASKQNAQPGELVDFTIRFDNVGDRVIGNVTVIDNLHKRLEYVDESQECSLAAEFLAPPNEYESLVLRWEITEPLEVGAGGVIRFQCRVR